MNYYAKAIEIIASLDRKLSTAETRIAMCSPSVFVKAFDPEKLYQVILNDHGLKKIACIKLIRELTGYGLKEAKEASESCPVSLFRSATYTDALKILKKFEEIGSSAIIAPQD